MWRIMEIEEGVIHWGLLGQGGQHPPLCGFHKGRRNYELVAYEKDRKESFDCIYTTRDYKKKKMHMITLREYGEIRYNPILLHYTENGCVAD